MSAAPHQWSTTAADNRSADTRGKLPTGLPASSLDDAIIALMQSAALARDDRTGILLATVNSANVYSVTTNEGLIDPATQVGGASGKISKPFILRVALPALTAPVGGTTPAPPTIVIDGAAAVPLKTTLGGAIADGDIPATRVFVILGDTVTSGAYTRARILDLLPSDIKAVLGPTAAAAGAKITVPAAQNIVPSYARTKITAFGTAVDGTGGKFTFDPATQRLTCAAAGSYLLVSRLTKDMPAGVNYSWTLDICRNGATQADLKVSQTNSTVTYTGTGGGAPAVLQVAQGDYFEAFGTHNYGTSNPLDYRVELVAVYLGA